jgi:hypothetical protein
MEKYEDAADYIKRYSSLDESLLDPQSVEQLKMHTQRLRVLNFFIHFFNFVGNRQAKVRGGN